ncbi:hypothetical protein HanRHA438_Chr09g0391651 [Helianthus annuus]|nr:hypothetical protein HanRHA438_Chr09g0391651 [Helianthus annuus]
MNRTLGYNAFDKNPKSRNGWLNMHGPTHKLKMSDPNHANGMQLRKMNTVKLKNFKKKLCYRQTKVAITEKIPKEGNIPGRSVCCRLPLFREQSTPALWKFEILN